MLNRFIEHRTDDLRAILGWMDIIFNCPGRMMIGPGNNAPLTSHGRKQIEKSKFIAQSQLRLGLQ